MADNPLVNTNTAASGAVNVAVAADDIGGVQYQRVKVTYGADGVATDVSPVAPLPVVDQGVLSIDSKTPALVGGDVPVTLAGETVNVTGSVSTGGLTDAQLRASAVPVSAASLPLPTGAATQATLASIDGKAPALVSGRVPVDGSGVTQPVSAASLPLPSGAATAAAQATGNASLASLDGKAPALVGGRVPVDGSGVTQPVSIAGTVPVSDGGGSLTVDGTVGVSGSVAVTGPLTDAQLRASAVPVSAASLPLPTGAATEATLAAMSAKVPAIGAPNDVALSMPVNVAAHEASYMPGYDGPSATAGALNVDPGGALLARAAVLTDEGTVRINFAGTSLAVSIGSVARSGDFFTGGSIGTAALDLHVGDFIKFDADPESAWCEVIELRDNVATVAGYTGSASSGAASRAKIRPYTGTGGSISVASGQCTIASGNTASSVTGLIRPVDYAPLVWRGNISLSQRIANQDFLAGLREGAATPRWFARFRFNGTGNTTVICETGWNPTGAPSASEQQSTTVTLPTLTTTATAQEYRVEVLTESVRFYVAGLLVAEHVRVIPAQHDEMAMVCEWINGTTPASSTNAVVDYITAKNHNKLETGFTSDSERLIAALQPMRELSFSQAGVIAINTDLLVIDCRQLASIQLQCMAMGTTGVVTPQWSNDPAFSVVVGATITTSAGADATTFNAAGLWQTPVVARYLRLRLTTATTAGTTTIMVNGSAFPAITRLATQPISGTVTASSISTSVTPGTAAANLGKAEDAVAASGDVGVFVLGVRRDALVTSSSASGDYNEMAVTRHGAQCVADFRHTARTYRAVTAPFVIAASPTDIWDLFGNASFTVVVTRIRVMGTQTTSGTADIRIRKRTTANSAGTRVASTAIPLEQADAAPTSAPGHYTANPTVGTDAGALDGGVVWLPAPASGVLVLDAVLGERGKGLVLSGTAQGVAVNLGGTLPTGAALTIMVEYYEF